MIEEITVNFDALHRPWSVMRRIFLDADRQDLVEAGRQEFGSYSVVHADDRASADRLVGALDRAEIEWSRRVSHVYEDEEAVDVVDRKGKPLAWKAIVDLPRLPAMRTGSLGLQRDRPCPVCGRDGYFFDAFDPVRVEYGPRELLSAPAVAFTAEHFGYSGLREPLSESHFAQPRVAVNPSIYRRLRQSRVPPYGYMPLHVV